jgi:hypothetical protein
MNKEQLNNIVIAEKPELEVLGEDGVKVRLIEPEDEKYLEDKYQEMIDYMVETHDQGASNSEKDEIYGKAQKMWNEVSGKNGGKLNEISFNLLLTKEEATYLKKILAQNAEYDVDTIFYAIEVSELIEDFIQTKFSSDKELKKFVMNATDMHYLYHLISKHKVRGLTRQAYTFANIIRSIGASSKLFNYYKEKYENLSKAIMYWAQSLEEGVSIDSNDPVYKLIWGNTDKKPKVVELEETEK